MRSRVLFLALPLLLLAGCSSQKSGDGGQAVPDSGKPVGNTPAAKQRGVIGLSVLTLTNPFFKVIADSMAAEAKKSGYEVVAVSGDFDPAKQQNQVKDFIVRKVAAIVLTPCDSKAIGTAIKEANEAGIPVFTADIKATDPNVKVVCHIATDNYTGGKMAGQAMIQALGEAGGKVVIIDHPIVESCQLRTKGFKEIVDGYNKEHPTGKIEVVADLPGGGVKDQGYKATEDALQAHPDVVGIFAINDPSGLGARAARMDVVFEIDRQRDAADPEGCEDVVDCDHGAAVASLRLLLSTPSGCRTPLDFTADRW